MSEAWPQGGLDIGEPGGFGFNVKAAQVGDAVIADVYNQSLSGRTRASCASGDLALMYLVRRGAWRATPPGRQGQLVVLPAGSFIVCYDGSPSSLEADPGSATTLLCLPALALGTPADRRHFVGSGRSAEVRVLMAHASMIGETARDLSQAGRRSARDALLELARGVLRRQLDDTEPLLAPALARAAMRIADSRLTDPDLSPSSLASELNVSVRTLHRAFAAAGEPVAAYVRRRLEEARAELAALSGRREVSEVAARWRFADNSHFTRAFRKQYGQTPAQFAREQVTPPS